MPEFDFSRIDTSKLKPSKIREDPDAWNAVKRQYDPESEEDNTELRKWLATGVRALPAVLPGGPVGAVGAAIGEGVGQLVGGEEPNLYSIGAEAALGFVPFGKAASLARSAGRGAAMSSLGTALRQQTQEGLHLPSGEETLEIGLSGGVGAGVGGVAHKIFNRTPKVDIKPEDSPKVKLEKDAPKVETPTGRKGKVPKTNVEGLDTIKGIITNLKPNSSDIEYNLAVKEIQKLGSKFNYNFSQNEEALNTVGIIRNFLETHKDTPAEIKAALGKVSTSYVPPTKAAAKPAAPIKTEVVDPNLKGGEGDPELAGSVPYKAKKEIVKISDFPEGPDKQRYYELVEKNKAGTLTAEELKEARILDKKLRGQQTPSKVDPTKDAVTGRPILPKSEAHDWPDDIKEGELLPPEKGEIKTDIFGIPLDRDLTPDEVKDIKKAIIAKEGQYYGEGDAQDFAGKVDEALGVIPAQSLEHQRLMDEIRNATDQGFVVYPRGYKGPRTGIIVKGKLSDGSVVGSWKGNTAEYKPLSQALSAGKETKGFATASGKTIDDVESEAPDWMPAETRKMIKETFEVPTPEGDKRNIVTQGLAEQRNLQTAFDLSWPFRQGITNIHQPEFWQSLKPMFKSAVEGKGDYTNRTNKMKASPTYHILKKLGVDFVELGSDLSKRDESMRGTWLEAIPGRWNPIRMSNQAYATMGNELRMALGKKFIQNAMDAGVDVIEDEDSGKAIAKFINDTTGRGNLGEFSKSADKLNELLFSPRLIASRINMFRRAFHPMYTAGGDPRVAKQMRMEALRSMRSVGGLGAMAILLSKGMGAEGSDDWTSTDFGKLKFPDGKTRMDVTGGFQGYARVANQITAALAGVEGVNPADQTAIRFVRNKLAPLPALIWDMLAKENVVGEKTTFGGEAKDKILPLIAQDLWELWTEENVDPRAKGLGTFGSILGATTQTYGENPRRKKSGTKVKLPKIKTPTVKLP